ncbi:Ufm1-specific protease 2 [Chamberlinius hualienensis]
MKAELVFSDKVWKRLENISIDNVALLLGFESDNSLYCIGCAKLPQNWNSLTDLDVMVRQVLGHVPCGIKVVGLYKFSNEEAVRNDCKFYLDTLTAPATLEELVSDPLLIFVWKQFEDSTTTFLYDTESEMISDATLSISSVDLQSLTVSLNVTGHLPVNFDLYNDIESTKSSMLTAIENAKRKVLTSCCTFHLISTPLLLRNFAEKPFAEGDFNAKSVCGDLKSYVQNTSDDEDKKTNSLMFKLKMLFLTTGKQATERTTSFVPVIRYERRSFETANVNVGIDVMVNVPVSLPLSKLPAVLCQGIGCQLDSVGHSISTFYEKDQMVYYPEICHFSLTYLDHLLTAIYPKNVSENDLESFRKDVHHLFFLPMDKPCIRRSMRFFPGVKNKGESYLQNVHEGLPPSGIEGGLKALVYGSYTYHHYMQDHMNDDGWGCAYRSLQTLISWFRHQGYTTEPVPTHIEIQKALVDIRDKPSSFINSKLWIGSMEVSFCLEKLIGITSKIMSVSSGSELASKGRELVNHFNTQGTPIMIGGGVLAHTIIGVDFNPNSGDIKFLILDPHYTGAEDIKVIHKKGWCGWKGVNFWNKTAYYNLCCPQRPVSI